MELGSKVYFSSEKRPYTVMAINNRFAVLTKPYNPKRTVIYTIIDFDKDIRGTENLIFCMGFETKENCEEALQRLTSGETEISRRNFRSLDIVER